MRLLLLSLISSCCLLSGAFDPHAWAHRRSIKPGSKPFASVSVDADLYRLSQARLHDLRLLHSGREIPYLVRTLSASSEEVQFAPALTDKAVIPHVGLQFVLDLNGAGPHNRVVINTRKSDFKQNVRVETSDDLKSWGLVRADATIFDLVSGEKNFANHVVSYPDSTRRFVRVTMRGWNNPDWVRSASARFVREMPAQREIVANLRPALTEKPKERETELLFDLGFGRPYDWIKLDVGPGLFSRTARIETSQDRKSWTWAGSATFERTAERTTVTAEFPEQWQRYVRIIVNNLDNAPLQITGAYFMALRRELIFPVQDAGVYWLYTGNPAAESPSYDLASILPASINFSPASLGPPEKNPEYRPKKVPVSNRSSFILTALLILLVPLVGTVAFRMLRGLKVTE